MGSAETGITLTLGAAPVPAPERGCSMAVNGTRLRPELEAAEPGAVATVEAAEEEMEASAGSATLSSERVGAEVEVEAEAGETVCTAALSVRCA
jgi:hypothetical protein